jgi:hypothetical protein
MASLDEAFKNVMEERKNIIQPNTHNDENDITSEIYADNDMGHFVLTNANRKLISSRELYRLVYADVESKHKNGLSLYYRKIPERTKTYSLNGKNITVKFLFPCITTYKEDEQPKQYNEDD